jgi:hypothetical protein
MTASVKSSVGPSITVSHFQDSGELDSRPVTLENILGGGKLTRAQLYWVLLLGGWLIKGTFDVLTLAIFRPRVLPLFLSELMYVSVAVLVTHLYRLLIRRWRWVELSIVAAIVRVVMGSLILGYGVISALMAFLVRKTGLSQFQRPVSFWDDMLAFAYDATTFLVVWSIFYFLVHYFENAQRSQSEKMSFAIAAKDAQMRSLLAQLNPHFIFNCLNSLRGLIAEDAPQATHMVTELSQILRHSLRSGTLATVPLSEELTSLKAYLSLEAVRFEERLQTELDIDPESLKCEVPPMLVQNLVENGIKYGIARRPQGGKIQVVTRRNGEVLTIVVINTGQITESAESTHMGLANARERLRLLYGERASLIVNNAPGECVEATVKLPAGI